MHNKLSNYTVILILYGLTNTAFGMNKDIVLERLVRKNIFPVLALNNYIVPVSSAYQALKKEVSIPYVSLQRSKQMSRLQITATNVRTKLALEKKGVVFTIDVSDIRKDIANPLRDYFKDIQIQYYPSSHVPARLHAYMSIDTYFHYSGKRLSRKEYVQINLSSALKNKVDVLLSRGTPLSIELYSEGNISDWVTITKQSQSALKKQQLKKSPGRFISRREALLLQKQFVEQYMSSKKIIKGEIPFVNDEESSEDNTLIATTHQPQRYTQLLPENFDEENLLDECYNIHVNDDIDKYIICPCFTLSYVTVIAGIFLTFYFSA